MSHPQCAICVSVAAFPDLDVQVRLHLDHVGSVYIFQGVSLSDLQGVLDDITCVPESWLKELLALPSGANNVIEGAQPGNP